MSSKYVRPYCLLLETLLIWAIGSLGQAAAQRSDTPPGIGSDCLPCSCSSSITASVIITTIVVLILVTLWWCYARHRARTAEAKTNPEALSRAAYDNPHFQGDELDQPDGGQVRINTISTSQPTKVSTSPCPSAKVKNTATNTTSTLERGKTTLERVIHAVIGGGRTGSSSKETKDDSCIGMPSQVSVPLHGHDFTGLGFTVHGNFKEGLFIKEVMSRGPASQSGQVIPGDRVSGFTVLTDHIVFEDAITILSYASVYPVLLHLEKGKQIGFTGAPSQSSKAKHSISAPSLTLMHPSFKKSQSFDDLHQVKILDIEKLKIGTIVPITSKSKQAPSPGLKHELPKIQNARHVQRSAESRHSERAIDVPGVEVKSKLKMPGGDYKMKAPDIKLDIGDLPDDKTELASVEVHRPMSTNIEMDMPSVDMNLPAFNDAKLSGATESFGVTAEFEKENRHLEKPDPKKKFGIKVFPDVAFPIKLNKNIDMDLERGETRSASLDIKGFDLTHENEMNMMKEKSFGVGLNAPEITLKTQRGDNDINLDQNIALSAEMPNLDIKPLQVENQKSGGGKFGFGLGFKGFSNDRDDVEREGSGYIDLDDSNMVLPSLNIKTDVSKDKLTKEIESDDEKKNKKSKHGFKIGMPDINLPSFGMKGSSNKDRESPEIESAEKTDEKSGKSKGFKLDLPDISLPSFSLNSGKNRKNSLESLETKEDLTIKLENPDINLPSVDLKTKLETDINLPKLDADIEKIDLSPDAHETDKSGLNLKLKGPNMKLPSLGFQTKGIVDEDISDKDDKDDDRKNKKNKQSLKFGLPDISMPSLNLKGSSKISKESDSENEFDLEIRKKREEEEARKKKESNFDMNLKMPDISMPTLSMNLDSNQQDKEKLDRDQDSSEKHKSGFSIGMPDFDLKLKGNKKKKSDHDEEEEDNVDKTNSDSKFGFKAELPDVSLPSYNLRKKKSNDHGMKVKMNAPDLPTPNVELKQNFEGDLKLKAPSVDISGLKLDTKISDDGENRKESNSSSSGLGINIKGPDVSLPTFGIKSKIDGDQDLNEIEEENKTKKEKKKSKEKSGFNFKFKGPEFSFPNFSNKGDKQSKEDKGELSSPDLDVDEKSLEIKTSKPKLDINAEMPNLNLESTTNVEPEKHSKKSKFGLSFKTPDLSMPSLHLKGKKKEGASDSDSHSFDPKINLPSSNIGANVAVSGVSTSSIDMQLPDINKAVEAEDLKLEVKDQDFSLPSVNLTGRRTSSDSKDYFEDTSKLDLNLEGPKISIPKLDINTEDQYKRGIGADIDGPDFEIPSFKLGTLSSSTKEKEQSPRSEDDEKDNNDKSKFNFKINLPDFSFPKFGTDSKEIEIDKLERKSKNEETSEFSLPDFKIKSNKEKRDIEFDSDFHINSPKVEMPDIALTARDAALSTENVHLPYSANKEVDEGKVKNKKGGFGFNMNLPEFNLPTLDFGSKDRESKNIEANYSLPDELKAEVNMRGTRDLDIHGVTKDIHLESPDFTSKEFTIPSLSSPDLGFEDEKIKSGKCDNQELDCKQDYDLSVRLPDLTIPKFGLKGKGAMGYEDEASNKNLSLDSNLPDIDTEFVDDDALDELNITDATKKKRFGFKIKGPELAMPDFLKRSSNTDERSVKVSMDGNQSDEVKSLNLKLKAPTVSLLEGGSSKMENERPEENEADSARVKLPRIQLPAFKSKLYVDDVNLDKSIGDSGYSDQGENKLCEADLPSPKFSSGIKLFGSSSNSKKFNESDEWKIKGGTRVDMPNLNFNIHSNDDVPEDDREHLLKYKMHDRDIEFNADDPDFVIPDFKSFSENIPSLKIESNADVPTKKNQENTEYFENGLPNFSLNLKKNAPKYYDETNDNSVFNIRGTTPYYPKYEMNSLNTNDINVSLDSSSLEAESDLPEAELDLQKASLDFPLDMSTLSDDFSSEEAKFTNKFGNAFGFQGFKKHVEVEGMDTSSNNEDLDVERKVSLNFSELEPPIETINRTIVVGDLPEADFHLDMKGIKQVDGGDYETNLPEVELPVGYSIQERLNAFEKGFDNKKRTTSESTDSEADKRKSRHRKIDLNEEMEIQERNKETINEKERKFSVEADEINGKLKGGRAGIGIGLKGFGRSSDSEDNNESPKIISNDTELGEGQEVKEKSRVKAKKTFSFKAFGRSSSDTDEENSEKVSRKPMAKPEQEEKVKLRNKNSLTFGFKQRSSKNSDSEDNGANDKVETNPQIDASIKKQKMFGFMNKSKPFDVEHSVHTELSGEKKDLDEESKIKSKSAITVSSRSTKEMKYDIKSESEPGEDEKMSMDSRGEDVRSKSRYGLNFGFKRNQGKTSSDSEGGDNEDRVNLNERGSSDKKESKGKSIKVFKGLKNLKGKIQSEINKMRHDSPSSDDDMHPRDDEVLSHGEKRKKVSKKKDKEKNQKHDTDGGGYLDTSEEAAITSAASAAKDTRRMRMDRQSRTSSSSSDSSSSDNEDKSLEVKKKKKYKVKRKEEGRIVTTGLTEVDEALNQRVENGEIDEKVSFSQRTVPINLSSLEAGESFPVNVVSSESRGGTENQFKEEVSMKQSMEIQSSPRRYVVVREMKLKQSPVPATDPKEEIVEMIEKENREIRIPPPVFPREKATFSLHTDTEGTHWGSDNDMGNRQLSNGVNISESSGKQRLLTDSEELKRRAASLGDLSRLHEGYGGTGNLLERAVSLDLKNASNCPPALHIRRLQLPDSSATSIDEADEPLSSSSPKKLELSGGLKAASQWGTLEEALRLGINSNEHIEREGSSTESSSMVTTNVVTTSRSNEGRPISNIEISGDRGPSVTALSVSNNCWNDTSFEDENPPSLPSSPIPVARTTITVKEEATTIMTAPRMNESNVVVVGANERLQNLNNIRNVSVEMNPTLNNQSLQSLETVILSGKDDLGFYSHLTDDIDRLMQQGGGGDSGIVTVTTIPADSYPDTMGQSPPPVPPKPKGNRTLSTPPELITYESITDAPIVTVNGEITIETSDHNLSDEFITPDSTPQKSMTQITLEGDGGYTVTEGQYSRTVIISNPDNPSPISIVQTDRDSSLPYLE